MGVYVIFYIQVEYQIMGIYIVKKKTSIISFITSYMKVNDRPYMNWGLYLIFKPEACFKSRIAFFAALFNVSISPV